MIVLEFQMYMFNRYCEQYRKLLVYSSNIEYEHHLLHHNIIHNTHTHNRNQITVSFDIKYTGNVQNISESMDMINIEMKHIQCLKSLQTQCEKHGNYGNYNTMSLSISCHYHYHYYYYLNVFIFFILALGLIFD